MIVLKCKMCGGDLEVQDSATTFTCKFCGSTNMLTGTAAEQKPTTAGPDLGGLLRNGQVYLAEEEYSRAHQCFAGVLHAQADNAEGYFGLFLCDVECPQQEKLEALLEQRYRDATTPDRLEDIHKTTQANPNLGKVKRYATGALAERAAALTKVLAAVYEERKAVLTYQDLERERPQLESRAKNSGWLQRDGSKLPHALRRLADNYKALGKYEDAPEREAECRALAEKLEQEFRVYAAEKRALEDQRKKRLRIIILSGVSLCVLAVGIWLGILAKTSKDNLAIGIEHLENVQYGEAYAALSKVVFYDREPHLHQAILGRAEELMQTGDYTLIAAMLNDYKADDSDDMRDLRYVTALYLAMDEQYEEAISLLARIRPYDYKHAYDAKFNCEMLQRGSVSENTRRKELQTWLAEATDTVATAKTTEETAPSPTPEEPAGVEEGLPPADDPDAAQAAKDLRDHLVAMAEEHHLAYSFADSSISTRDTGSNAFTAVIEGSRQNFKFTSFDEKRTFNFSCRPGNADQAEALPDLIAACILYADSGIAIEDARSTADGMLFNYSKTEYTEPLFVGEYALYFKTSSAEFFYLVHEEDFWRSFEGEDAYASFADLPPATYQDYKTYGNSRVQLTGTVTSVEADPSETYNYYTIQGNDGITYWARAVWDKGPFIPAVGTRYQFYAKTTYESSEPILEIHRIDETDA